MHTPTQINMARPHAFYLGGLFMLLLLSLLITNIPELSISHYFDWPHRKHTCSALLAIASIFAVSTYYQYRARIAHPWRVPQSLVQALYCLFLFFSISALLFLK